MGQRIPELCFEPSTTGGRVRIGIKITIGRILWILSCVSPILGVIAGPALAQVPPPDKSVVIINRIVFTGNDNISADRLKRQMATKEPSFFAVFRKPQLDDRLVKRDVATLEGFYHSIGYFEARVTLAQYRYSPDGRYVDIMINVVEGEPTLVESVEFSEGTLFPQQQLRVGLLLEEGAAFNRSLLDTDIYNIKTKYFRRGYLAVTVRESAVISGHSVRISYDISPGTTIAIQEISIAGLSSVKKSVVEKEFAFKAGELCLLDKLLETQRNLFETGLFAVVDIEPTNLDPIERTVDLVVHLRERDPAYVEAGFGVGNIVGSRVAGEWGTRNLRGTGKTLRARVEYAYDLFEGDAIDFGKMQLENIYYRYDLTFQQRRVFGTKVLLGLEGYFERDATLAQNEFRTIGASVGGRRRFGDYSEVIGGMSFDTIKRDTPDPNDEPESSSHILSTSVNRDRRDFVLNPRSGSYRTLRAQLAGGALGGDNDFYTLSATYQRYTPVGGGLVIAWRARVGYGSAYGGSARVPIEKRFFLGGANSVRGYREASLGPSGGEQPSELLGGEFMILSNLELRHKIPLLSRWHISGTLFGDGGNVWADIKDVSLGDFKLVVPEDEITFTDYRYSVGYGLRYDTPIGPVRLDLALPLKAGRLDDSGEWWHLTLGQIF